MISSLTSRNRAGRKPNLPKSSNSKSCHSSEQGEIDAGRDQRSPKGIIAREEGLTSIGRIPVKPELGRPRQGYRCLVHYDAKRAKEKQEVDRDLSRPGKAWNSRHSRCQLLTDARRLHPFTSQLLCKPAELYGDRSCACARTLEL